MNKQEMDVSIFTMQPHLKNIISYYVHNYTPRSDDGGIILLSAHIYLDLYKAQCSYLIYKFHRSRQISENINTDHTVTLTLTLCPPPTHTRA